MAPAPFPIAFSADALWILKVLQGERLCPPWLTRVFTHHVCVSVLFVSLLNGVSALWLLVSHHLSGVCAVDGGLLVI